MAEFQAEKAPTGLQDAPCLAQGIINMRDVAQAEGDRIDIESVVGERQAFGVAGHPLKTPGPALIDGAVTADAQHLFVQIADGDIAALADALMDAEGDVACAARDIEIRQSCARANTAYERIFPDPVQAAGHEVVHQIVTRGDGIKDAAHQPGFFIGADVFLTEPFTFRVKHGKTVLQITINKQCECTENIEQGLMKDQPEYEDPYDAAERQVTIWAMQQEVMERDLVILRQAGLLLTEERDTLSGKTAGLTEEESQAVYDFLDTQRNTISPLYEAFTAAAKSGDLEVTKAAYDLYMETTDDIMPGICDEAFYDPEDSDPEDDEIPVAAPVRAELDDHEGDWTPDAGFDLGGPACR